MFHTAGGSGSHHAYSASRPVALALLILFCCATMQPAWAVITTVPYGPFDVSFYGSGDTYTQGSTSYTGSANWTSTEKDDVGAMIRMWDNGLNGKPGTVQPRQIKLNLLWNSMASGILGSSSNYFTVDSTTAVTNSEELWREGKPIGNPNADAFILFNSTSAWNFGAGASSSGTWDFRSTVAHEIGHSLGFISTYGLVEANKWWGSGLTAWDKHLRDALTGGNQPNAGGSGTPLNFNVTANPVYFDGANAIAANNAARVAVYAPSTFSSGASLTHLNESTFPNALMSPSLTDGQMVRQPTLLEWQIMKDLGWTLDTTTKTWSNSAGNLQWATDNNWNPSSMPNAIQKASFTNAGLTSGVTVNLGGDYAVGGLSFDTTTTFSIGGTSGTLTIGPGGITRSSSSSGTQTISRPINVGANTVSVAGTGSLILSGGVTQLVGNTLTGGTWKVQANCTLDIATGGSITTNQGDVTLDGLGSTFNKINALADNQGAFSVLNGRNFTTLADLDNSGTLTIGTGSNFIVHGNLTGTGITTVVGTLTANSITQNTLNIGSEFAVGMPSTEFLGGMTAQSVPEPGTLIMLFIACATAGAMRKLSRPIG
jgi:hypothetical protein